MGQGVLCTLSVVSSAFIFVSSQFCGKVALSFIHVPAFEIHALGNLGCVSGAETWKSFN